MTFPLITLFMVLVFWRPQEWLIPQLEGWPILDVIFTFTAGAFLMELDQGTARFPSKTPQVYMLLGLWVAACMSHIAHTYFAGLMATIGEVLKPCVFSIVLLAILDRPSRLRVVALIFVSMACVMSVHALLQQDRGYGFVHAPPLYVRAIKDRAAYTRSLFFGIFADPNDMAQMLATSIPFVFALPKRLTFIKLLPLSAIVALLVRGILSTHSRGGIVALVTAGVLLIPGLFRSTRWQKFAMLGLLVGFIALCPFSGGMLEQSAHDRVIFWGEANAAFKRNPLFGVGRNMLGEVALDARAIHNAFVLSYGELGVFGHWFWFGMLQLGIVGAWRGRRAVEKPAGVEQAWLKRFAAMSVAAAGGYFASAYFLTRTFHFPTFFLFSVLAAVPLVVARTLSPDHPPLINIRRDVFLWCTVGTVLSIVYIYISIVLLNAAY